MRKDPHTATFEWLNTIHLITHFGDDVAPRGKKTRELRQHTVRVDLAAPLVAVPERKLSRRFACAEALWMLDGDNRVEPLARFAPRMREFSDDGVTLAGAYGPRIAEQLDYVHHALRRDRDTRQAVLTIWKPCPAPSKDIPCTVALDFKIRRDRLNVHAFMRSSDAWLGLPYDVFSFAMVGAFVACRYNRSEIRDAIDVPRNAGVANVLQLGGLYLTAASSHLYESNWAAVDACLETPVTSTAPHARVPDNLIRTGGWRDIRAALEATRDADAPLWGDAP